MVAAPVASAHGSYRHCTTSASLFAANNPDFRVAIPLGYSGSQITATCYLTNGDSGRGVRVLQRALNKCYSAGLAVHGVFGRPDGGRAAQSPEGHRCDRRRRVRPQHAEAHRLAGLPHEHGRFVHCYKWSNIQWALV